MYTLYNAYTETQPVPDSQFPSNGVCGSSMLMKVFLQCSRLGSDTLSNAVATCVAGLVSVCIERTDGSSFCTFSSRPDLDDFDEREGFVG